ncbi:MAG: pentapeptide repeat-containing protein [Proteobacteria bacterium]|nr:pentapeptide repeat-containing protein [Pseudomonadota bacterium]
MKLKPGRLSTLLACVWIMLDYLFGLPIRFFEWIIQTEAADPSVIHGRVIVLFFIIFLILLWWPILWPATRHWLFERSAKSDKTEELSIDRKGHAILATILLIIVVALYVLPYGYSYSRDARIASSWNIIHQFSGREAPAGRKQIIEALVKDGADLTRIDISHAWLGDLQVPGAKMRDAIMMMVRLKGADFRDAEMQGAIFSGAQLQEVDFRGTNLSGAIMGSHDVKRYDLPQQPKHFYKGANLSEAKFDNNTDMKGAYLLEVENLTCVQLIQTKNWETTFRDEKLGCGEKIPEWEGRD